MITQIKRWFQKLFAWWPWQDEPVTTYAPMDSHLNRGISPEPLPRPPVDGTFLQPGVAPQVGSQGEPRCSTMQEWPEPDPTNTSHAQLVDNDWEREPPLPQPPSQVESDRENIPTQGDKAAPTIPPVSTPAPSPAPTQAAAPPMTPALSAPRPTEEQHLEFLRYLVRRGLVNEGFTEGHVPDQYRKK
jgi:hypothetical protein